MELNKTVTGNKAIVMLDGRIDAKISPELEAEMLALTKEIKALDLDFSQVDYISSAGLRTLMVVQNELEDKGGSMKILNPGDEIMEIFEVTGFTDFLTIGN